MLNWTAANGYKDENALNVYAFGWASFAGGIASGRLTCGVGSNGLGGNTTVHEVSHNLSLRHTRSADEHTTRDPNDPNFNATTAGDRVVDTAANSGFWEYSCGCTPYIDPLTCTYFGTEEDELGDPYQIEHEDVINIMGNAYSCMKQYVTVGQGIRAREAIAAGHYDVALTTLASLYEPYAGEYFVTRPPGPPTVDELVYRPLFQPGFDYRFVECCCAYPEPSDYNDTSFSYTNNSLLTISKYETDFNKITHPNHTAIYIDLRRLQSPNQDTRKCYDNWNRSPIMGTLVKFNDNVFNANVTITQKDSIGINNPNLINELETGLYKIEKRYEDGGVQESIIFKEN